MKGSVDLLEAGGSWSTVKKKLVTIWHLLLLGFFAIATLVIGIVVLVIAIKNGSQSDGVHNVCTKTDSIFVASPGVRGPFISLTEFQDSGKAFLNNSCSMVSEDGLFAATMQSDCNLVAYNLKTRKVLFSTRTEENWFDEGCYAELTYTGNFRITSKLQQTFSPGTSYFESETGIVNGTYFDLYKLQIMNGTGEVVLFRQAWSILYPPTNLSNWIPIWSLPLNSPWRIPPPEISPLPYTQQGCGPTTNIITSGERVLWSGCSLTSANKHFAAMLTLDCNFFTYNIQTGPKLPIFSTNSSGYPGCFARITEEGNFVIEGLVNQTVPEPPTTRLLRYFDSGPSSDNPKLTSYTFVVSSADGLFAVVEGETQNGSQSYVGI